MGCRVEIATDIAGCAKTVPISLEVWGAGTLVPPQLLLAAVHNGGFVGIGSVAGDDDPAGFVFGFLGRRDGALRHHSHMLAVRAPHRATGLARALKEAQRAHCLAQGVTLMTWTTDPLEARNARFNLGTLGARTHEYHRDFYGAMPDRLNAGLPSDRFTIEWHLDAPRTAQRLAGTDAPPALEALERTVPALVAVERERPVGLRAPAGEPRLLLGIPVDYQALKRGDASLALAWRHVTRTAFEDAFRAGYEAVELVRAADGRVAYLLALRGAAERS